jgi:hypothetical protein
MGDLGFPQRRAAMRDPPGERHESATLARGA